VSAGKSKMMGTWIEVDLDMLGVMNIILGQKPLAGKFSFFSSVRLSCSVNLSFSRAIHLFITVDAAVGLAVRIFGRLFLLKPFFWASLFVCECAIKRRYLRH
jgi:hypothetical protein